MGKVMRAIETTGRLEAEDTIRLDRPLPGPLSQPLRLIVLFPIEADEADDLQWLQGASANPAFAFLSDPEEDIYSIRDGKPLQDER